MSVMERRLQLLLDQERYDRVAAEAERSGRSVAAVIREAIDVRFDDASKRRAAAAREFLRLSEQNRDEPALEPREIKDAMDRELEEYFERANRP